MSVNNELAGDHVVRPGIESFEFNQEDEDIAWADSCLIKVSELSDGDWNSVKDVLLELICSQPESFNSSTARNNSFPLQDDDMDIFPSVKEEEVGNSAINNEQFPNNEAEETNNYGDLSEETIRKAFLPTFKEFESGNDASDSKGDAGFPILQHEFEPSTDDLFKVWDLEIPDEEDELLRQLKTALSRGSSPSLNTVLNFNDSGEWKDLREETLDDLADGIANLSLDRSSS